MKIIWLIPSVFLLFIVFNGGESLQCYSCTAQRNSSSSCETNVSVAASSENCTLTGNFTHCLTATTNSTITRTCANNSSCSQNGYAECYLCNSDYCNNASFVGVPNNGTGGYQPGIGGSQPGIGGSQPGLGGSQPGLGGSQPGIGGSQPGVVSKPKPGSGQMTGALILPVVICAFLSIVIGAHIH